MTRQKAQSRTRSKAPSTGQESSGTPVPDTQPNQSTTPANLSEHHETIQLACSQLLKSLDSRDPQQRVIAKSCLAVIDAIDQGQG